MFETFKSIDVVVVDGFEGTCIISYIALFLTVPLSYLLFMCLSLSHTDTHIWALLFTLLFFS